MRGLYRMYVDCGRMGEVESLFMCQHEEISAIMGEEIYFGEILGKHSEVKFELKPDHVELLSTDEALLQVLEDAIGYQTISGHNPLEYYKASREE